MIGAQADKIRGTNQTEAAQANNSAHSRPATVQEVSISTTADLNRDGFVTLDEVVAMSTAGLPEQEILRRLQNTGQVFELTDEQKRYLTSHGVSQNVVNQMPELNQTVRNQLLQNQGPSGVIGTPSGTR